MVIDRQRVGGSAKIQSGPGAASNIPRAAALLRPLKPDRWRNRDYATPQVIASRTRPPLLNNSRCAAVRRRRAEFAMGDTRKRNIGR